MNRKNILVILIIAILLLNLVLFASGCNKVEAAPYIYPVIISDGPHHYSNDGKKETYMIEITASASPEPRRVFKVLTPDFDKADFSFYEEIDLGKDDYGVPVRKAIWYISVQKTGRYDIEVSLENKFGYASKIITVEGSEYGKEYDSQDEVEIEKPLQITDLEVKIDGDFISIDEADCLKPEESYEFHIEAESDAKTIYYTWRPAWSTEKAQYTTREESNLVLKTGKPGDYSLMVIASDSKDGYEYRTYKFCVREEEEEVEEEEEYIERGITATAPAIDLLVIEGPTLSTNGICYYKIKAEVSGSPSPSIDFSRDDSNGAWGPNIVQINLSNPDDGYELSATAKNSEGSAADSIYIGWGCEIPEEVEEEQEEQEKDQEEEYQEENSCPASILMWGPTEMGTWNTATYTVEAFDADGDELTYQWSVSCGTIDGIYDNGLGIYYTAPDSPGTCMITVYVSDGICTRSSKITVEIED